MKLKKYIAPKIEIINTSTYGNLLDWVIGSIKDGEGDVDAKQNLFEEEGGIEDEEYDLYFKKFHIDVWQDTLKHSR